MATREKKQARRTRRKVNLPWLHDCNAEQVRAIAKRLDNPPGPGWLEKQEQGVTLDAQIGAAGVDTTRMSVTATIVTPGEDRDGDRLNPLGAVVDNYRRNPVVLWMHGHGLDLPIAKSEDPQGKLTLAASESELIATSYFSESLPEAVQIFALIAEGIVRATSVSGDPIIAKAVTRDSGKTGLDVEEWEIYEWSWVNNGANPEAIRKCLDRKKCGDTRLGDWLLKSLEPKAANCKPQGKGFDMDEEHVEKMGDEEEVEKTAEEEELEKAGDEQDPNATPEEAPADDVEKAEEEMPEEEPEQVPPGQKFLSDICASLTMFADELEAGLAMQEREGVRAFAEPLIAAMREQAMGAEGVLSQEYNASVEKAEESEEEPVVKYLAKSKLARVAFDAIKRNIEKARQQNKDAKLSRLLKSVDESFHSLNIRAKQDRRNEQLVQKRIADLEKRFQGSSK